MNAPPQPLCYCPRCRGSAFARHSVKQWRCDTCGFSFYQNTAAAVAALIEDGRGRLLLTRRRYAPAAGTLDLPGGFVDPGESAEEALAREIREELGLTVTGMSYFASFPNRYRYGNVDYETLDLAFRVQIETFQAISVGDDVSGALFLEHRDIDPAAIGLVSIRQLVQAWLAAVPHEEALAAGIAASDEP